MAEFHFMAINSDPYQKGDLQQIYANDQPYPPGHLTGTWAIVKVPALTLQQVRNYINPWRFDIRFDVVAHNATIDGYRLKIYNNIAGQGAGNITLSKVTEFLNLWNMTLVSSSANEIIVDVSIYQAATSPGMFGRESMPSAVIFAESSYVEGTGIHTITCDYSAVNISPTAVETMLENMGATIISHSAQVATYEVDRSDVKTQFERSIQFHAKGKVLHRRYRISEAAIDAIMAAGGIVTRTPEQLQAALIDKATEI